jgi:hypothetical protein
VTKSAISCFIATCLLGCATAEASRESDSKLLELTPTNAAGDDNPLKAVVDDGDQSLRRAYASADMKSHACATRQDDGTILGDNCPSGIVVFGPYVTVPPNSDVRLRFDIESPAQLHIMSDMVSASAKQFHAALEDQMILANQRQTIRYRVHLFDAVRALESRIGIRADGPARFTITNFQLDVQ